VNTNNPVRDLPKPAVWPGNRHPLSVGSVDPIGGRTAIPVVGQKESGPTCRKIVSSFNTLVGGTAGVLPTRKDGVMRFMLIQNYGGVELESTP